MLDTIYLTPKEGFSCKIRCIYHQKEDFHVRYDVSNTKNGKIMLLSDSEGSKKRKESEKRGYRRIESFLVLF